LVAAAQPDQGSEMQLRSQLHALHSFILSFLTQAQINLLFQRHPNLDLRPIIEGSKHQLIGLCAAFQQESRFLIGCVESMRVPKDIRKKFGAALQTTTLGLSKLLYGMILYQGKLISLIRPRTHSLHPSDLFNLFTLITGNPQFATSEHWLPVCLPKFNDAGFLFMYITFLTPDMGLVLLSGDKEAFFEMKNAKEIILEVRAHFQRMTKPCGPK
jgi:hypothetical protein